MTNAPPPLPPGWEQIDTPETATVVGDEVTLSPGQEDAVRHILGDDYLIAFLTGQAGAGKSTVANHLMSVYGISCCATTGKAAVGNGSHWTVDALFGLNRNTWEVDLRRAQTNMKNMSEIILIDEGSMVGEKMLNALGEAASYLGKKLVLVGDWAQAKPVKDDWATKSKYFNDEHFIKLTENHRQSDETFLKALNAIRRGEVTADVEEIFRPRVLSKPLDAPGWVRMYATNRETDRFNIAELNRHCDRTRMEPSVLMSSWKDLRPAKVQDQWPLRTKEALDKIEDSNFANREPIAPGAQVMITCNGFAMHHPIKGMTRAYVNGDIGKIVDLELTVNAPIPDPDSPVSAAPEQAPSWKRGDFSLPVRSHEIGTIYIELERNKKVVALRRHTKLFQDAKGRDKLSISGFPLRLGYALTIHKSQGTTVDRAWLDMESILKMPKEGRHGLAYVGMSRSRTLQGLYLSNWAPQAIVCDPDVRHLI